MKINGIEILAPGAMTTVQDFGRIGYGDRGFSPSGAADGQAMEIGNLLVGNIGSEAVLECTLMGPTIQFLSDTVIALTGANMHAKNTLEDLPLNRALQVKAGDIVQLGMASDGCRGYIAFAGGLEVPEVLGSKSLNQKCKMGGGFGRPLQAGDQLKLGKEGVLKKAIEERIYTKPAVKKNQEAENTVRQLHVVLGPQEASFTEEGIHTFTTQPYIISNDSNRMACKMTGPEIACVTTSDIISDGIALGAVQISSNGQPIVMLADRQTTGGYAKIATVISTDIPILAQCKPGEKVVFCLVTLREAQRRYRRYRRELNRFRKKIM